MSSHRMFSWVSHTKSILGTVYKVQCLATGQPHPKSLDLRVI